MDLGDILLNKISQTERQILCNLDCVYNLK
jgi:hypothetical protein